MMINRIKSRQKRFLIEIVIVFLVITLIFGYIQFILLKEQRDNQINQEAMMIANSIKDGINTNDLASEAIEEQVDLRMIQTAKLVAERLQSNKWQTVTDGELESLRIQLGLSGITLFSKLDGVIQGVKATDPNEIGFSYTEFGYEKVVQDLLDGKKPYVEGTYTDINIMVTPIAQSGSHTDIPTFFKYVYYHPPEADYFINIYSEANEVYELTNVVGVDQWIEGIYEENPTVKEVGVLNLRVIQDPSLEQTLYPPMKKVEYGQFQYETIEDIEWLKGLQAPEKINLVQTSANGEKVIKVFLPMDEDSVVYMSFDYNKMSQLIYNNSTIQFISTFVSLIALFVLTARYFKRINRAEKKINFLAYHDELTDLPNRRLLKQKLDEFESQQKSVALLYLDIDNFKYINDTFGHVCGDELIKAASGRILDGLSNDAIVSRVGGDEFVVVIPNYLDLGQVENEANKILQRFVHSFEACGQEVFVDLSIGISLYPECVETMDELIQSADTAMYYAKTNGKNQFQLYSVDMTDEFTQKILLESELRHALTNQEFLLYYQPQIDVTTRSIVGVEALIRWKHPKKGMIPPLEFIPYAEKSSLIVPIGAWVLREAIIQIQKWKKIGLPDLKVSVNLSARQFFNENMFQEICDTLNQFDVCPGVLELEITESTMMNNPEATIKTIKELQRLGIRMAMDDFGTGYSSLSYLKEIPIDTLKIDRSFIKGINKGQMNNEILSTIISLGRSMNLTVISEGIETNEQFEMIGKFGSHQAQGYLFGRPMPPEEFEELLRRDEK